MSSILIPAPPKQLQWVETPGWIFIYLFIIIIIIIIIIVIIIIIITIIITIITLEVGEKWEKRRLIIDSGRCAYYSSLRFYNFIEKLRHLPPGFQGGDARTRNPDGTSWFKSS